MPKHNPIATTRSVSLLRNRRAALNAEGKTNTPTKNHMMRKNANFPTLYNISPPSTLLLTAIDDNITIINTAKRSSTMSTANTIDANFLCLKFISVNALMMIVVDDIDNIPPRKRLLICENPSKCPIIKPPVIIPITIISAVTTAEPPTFTNFLKLNSSPRENSNTTIPICAQNSIFSAVLTDGRYSKLGLAKKPATIYPSTTGCFIHLNNIVTTAPRIKINARSVIRDVIIIYFVFIDSLDLQEKLNELEKVCVNRQTRKHSRCDLSLTPQN